MIQKLRRKFIGVSMLSMFLVLLTIMGTVNVLNYRDIVTQADNTLALLQEWGLIGSPGEAFDAADDGDAEDTIAYSGGIPNIAIA